MKSPRTAKKNLLTHMQSIRVWYSCGKLVNRIYILHTYILWIKKAFIGWATTSNCTLNRIIGMHRWRKQIHVYFMISISAIRCVCTMYTPFCDANRTTDLHLLFTRTINASEKVHQYRSLEYFKWGDDVRRRRPFLLVCIGREMEESFNMRTINKKTGSKVQRIAAVAGVRYDDEL